MTLQEQIKMEAVRKLNQQLEEHLAGVDRSRLSKQVFPEGAMMILKDDEPYLWVGPIKIEDNRMSREVGRVQ